MRHRADYSRKRAVVKQANISHASAPALPSLAETIPVSHLPRYIEAWINDGKYQMLSPKTLAARRLLTDKLLWFVSLRTYTHIDKSVIKDFLAYIAEGHNEEGGRWQTSGSPHRFKPVKPATIATYFRILRTLFTFLTNEEVISASPMAKMKKPIERLDQITPFTQGQIHALLTSAKSSRHPYRDTALILFLLDTGARASEAVNLKMQDVNLTEGYVSVLGKGSKTRRLRLSPPTRKALAAYIRQEGREADASIWLAEGGWEKGEGLTRDGLYQLIARLGQAAGIDGVRCSPHTFRHTFAVEFLRQGGHAYALMEMLGHTSMTITKRYVSLVEADLAEQHRQFSPVQSLLGEKAHRNSRTS